MSPILLYADIKDLVERSFLFFPLEGELSLSALLILLPALAYGYLPSIGDSGPTIDLHLSPSGSLSNKDFCMARTYSNSLCFLERAVPILNLSSGACVKARASFRGAQGMEQKNGLFHKLKS